MPDDIKKECGYTFASTLDVKGDWVDSLSPGTDDGLCIPLELAEAVLKS